MTRRGLAGWLPWLPWAGDVAVGIMMMGYLIGGYFYPWEMFLLAATCCVLLWMNEYWRRTAQARRVVAVNAMKATGPAEVRHTFEQVTKLATELADLARQGAAPESAFFPVVVQLAGELAWLGIQIGA